MVSGGGTRDRFVRTASTLFPPDEVDFLMDRLAPVDWSEVATKADLRDLATASEMRVGFAQLRTEMAELRGDLRAEMHTVVRSWTFAVMGLQAATIAGVIAAVRI